VGNADFGRPYFARAGSSVGMYAAQVEETAADLRCVVNIEYVELDV